MVNKAAGRVQLWASETITEEIRIYKKKWFWKKSL